MTTNDQLLTPLRRCCIGCSVRERLSHSWMCILCRNGDNPFSVVNSPDGSCDEFAWKIVGVVPYSVAHLKCRLKKASWVIRLTLNHFFLRMDWRVQSHNLFYKFRTWQQCYIFINRVRSRFLCLTPSWRNSRFVYYSHPMPKLTEVNNENLSNAWNKRMFIEEPNP